jgi:hypothetical protein
MYFTSINKAAYIFGGLFVVQGVFFLGSGAIRPKISLLFKPNPYAIVGSIFILYALLIYPILGYLAGHGYPKGNIFPLSCPLVIFTFGLLLWTDQRVPKHIIVIPLIWAVIATGESVSLGFLEDIGLLVAGVASTILILARDRRQVRKS